MLSLLLDAPPYTGELLGWGVDFAYLAALGANRRDAFAIMHRFQVRGRGVRGDGGLWGTGRVVRGVEKGQEQR